MKALVYHGKDSLALEEMEAPKISEGEALIKVHYAGICGSDLNIWHGALSRIVPPIILTSSVGRLPSSRAKPKATSRWAIGWSWSLS